MTRRALIPALLAFGLTAGVAPAALGVAVGGAPATSVAGSIGTPEKCEHNQAFGAQASTPDCPRVPAPSTRPGSTPAPTPGTGTCHSGRPSDAGTGAVIGWPGEGCVDPRGI